MEKPSGGFLCSWSGGKDSYYALQLAIESGLEATVLLNVLNESGMRSRSHGISKELLQAQAKALNVPIQFFSSSWETYEENYIEALQNLKKEYAITHTVFGDIDIESHRAWEEKVSASACLQPVLPLWQQSRKALVIEMLELGIEPLIVSCNQQMGARFLGQILSKSLLTELEEMGIDPCGENGEYHTLVVNAPLFKHRLAVKLVKKETASDYHFAYLKLN